MSRKQRNILLGGVVAAVIAGLLPPWNYTRSLPYRPTALNPAGYYFILDSPTTKGGMVGDGFSLDLRRLFVEWAVIALVAGCCLMFMGRSRPSPKSTRQLSVGDRVTSITCGNCGSAMTVTDNRGDGVHLHCSQCLHVKVVRHHLSQSESAGAT